MELLFIKTFIPNSKALNVNLGYGISCYEAYNKIYILANAPNIGLITQELKENIDLKLKPFLKQILHISIFENRIQFAESENEIARGTYAWFYDSPEHYIHFDDMSSAKSIS